MAYTKLIPRHTSDARVEVISGDTSHYRLSLPAGKSDKYRLAQLDDYAQLGRANFPLRSPLALSLSARMSSDSIPGTWGVGLWNDPFGLSLGFGGNPFRLPVLPNAAWFFGASKENYLSFKESGDAAANGWIVQAFRSPRFHPRLIPAGLALPFSRKTTRRFLANVIEEAGLQLWNPLARRPDRELAPGLHNVDPTQWHRYRLDWREKQVLFGVDNEVVFESSVSPHSPLGLVIWIDNQYAAFTPEGKIGFGVLENPEPAWLEIKDLEITSAASSA
ncbi:MAG: hypothetical protein ACM3XO_07660 [Bacteroidota bacterium]